MEKHLKKNIYSFAVYLKVTQHCKTTILQLKKKKKAEELKMGGR